MEPTARDLLGDKPSAHWFQRKVRFVGKDHQFGGNKEASDKHRSLTVIKWEPNAEGGGVGTEKGIPVEFRLFFCG